LAESVEIKLYSFQDYLWEINFKGYAKWIILSQCFRENHPHCSSLYDLNIGNNAYLQDDIYRGMLKWHKEEFMKLDEEEDVLLQKKA